MRSSVHYSFVVCCVLMELFSPSLLHAKEGDGATLFEKNCYGCHSIGEGDKTGPDLKGVTNRRTREWIQRFVPAPLSMKDSGDPTAVKLFQQYSPIVMPNQLISADQTNLILDMIEELTEKNQSFAPAGGKKMRQPTKEDILAGERLFTGELKLSRGGAPCLSCHSVAGVGVLGGGTLGPDLTQVNQKFNDVELTGILRAPVFPTMSKIFAKHAITDDEVVQLFGFLRSVKTRTPIPNRDAARNLVAGAIGSLLLLNLMNFTWRGRLRGVRKLLLRERDP